MKKFYQIIITAIVIAGSVLMYSCTPTSSGGPAADTSAGKASAYKYISTDGSGTYYVFCNPSTDKISFTVDIDLSSDADCLADQENAGLTPLDKQNLQGITLKGKTITLSPMSNAIFKKP